ncbi:TetR family transcriptional regulator [Corynebacterium aurimucosum]|uniref:TetR/AcrR family transcriptional regulator n=1 Tax=Corynebacterium TaxID=1716 RepID=UPI0008A32C3E|nr:MULTISPECIES: TetR/AcrR family transcriptional regulator [Corynebacterium]MBE7365434.1 TetR family transcriptional regulator [Corynebacterium aurimucosum]MCZ9298584.1 TetR family transcriptional regulator [Corynebacterium hesseae]OFN17828.1 TetR family transcriptional regulator [Corynebacterium sp. HMSC055A01]
MSTETATVDSGSVEHVIDVAIAQFSEHGYADTKLETVSKMSGMSKRMIHYYFGDKKGLYQQALAAAAQRLNPPEGSLEINSAVPVEGVRTLVDWMFRQHVDNPEAIRMLTMESSHSVLESSHALVDVSAISLHLDRLLMLGQDSGAFRPGISANDIFTLISALTMYRVTNHAMMSNLLDIDMHTHNNTEGLHRMAVDAVLAFLTANIPDIGFESYLKQNETELEAESAPLDVYSTEDEGDVSRDLYE